MKKVKLLIKKIDPLAKLPTKNFNTDAGLDLYSIEDLIINPTKYSEVRTGILVVVPNGYYGQIMCRSGLGRKGLRIHHGVWDAGYTGEVIVFLHNSSNSNFIDIKKGDKIAQLLILPVPDIEIEEVKEIPKTKRGTNGWGSSGR
jgi:dUTP pyrophosphatase